MSVRQDGRSRLLLVVLVVATILGLLSMPFLLMGAVMSSMAADSCIAWPIKLFILTAMTLPIAVLAALIVGWISYWRKKERWAWLGLGLLMLWPLVLVGSLQVAARVC